MTDLSGRICLVTGATRGIGRATAEGLARMGATVLVHGRDAALVETVCREISVSSEHGEADGFIAEISAHSRKLPGSQPKSGIVTSGSMCWSITLVRAL